MLFFFSTRFQYFFYPTYHTNYDTFEYVKKFIDPTFAYHRLMGQLFVNMLHKLLDSALLPLSTRYYSTLLDPVFLSSRTVMEIFFSDRLAADGDLLGKMSKSLLNKHPEGIQSENFFSSLNKKC